MTYVPSQHIIQSTDNVPLLANIRDIILTIMVWGLYFYFMQDVFGFLGDLAHWSLGGFANAATYASFHIFHTIFFYLCVIMVVEVIFVGWSLYNILRFGRKNRRHQPAPVTVQNLATLYHLRAEYIQLWQRARVLIIDHDSNGRIKSVEVRTPRQDRAA